MANPLVTPGLEGARAAMDQDPVAACPYRPGTPEHGEWVREWNMIEAGRRDGASPEAKEALGLAPTLTRTGYGSWSPVHPNWATPPTAKADEVRWFRPEPEPDLVPDYEPVERRRPTIDYSDSIAQFAASAMGAAATFQADFDRWYAHTFTPILSQADLDRIVDRCGLSVAPRIAAPDPLPADPKARALAVKQRRGQRPCPVHGPTPGGLCRVCTRR